MACITAENVIQVSIPSFEISQENKTTHYRTIVNIGNVSWSVERRYSSFAELHDSLVTNHGLARDLLPPKKLIGNKSPTFIEKRRCDLELYLQTVVSFMSVALPEQLAEFLEFKKYEIRFLLQFMARHFFREGEELLEEDRPLFFNPLQLMAISQQLKRPHSCTYVSEHENDFTNVVDVCSSVRHLNIEGCYEKYQSSNIILNELSYSLTVFKNVKTLNIYNACLSKIEKLGPLRKSVRSVTVKDCNIYRLSDVLLCDFVHKEVEENPEYSWTRLIEMELSSNSIVEIDKSVILTRALQHLNLSSNNLSDVGPYLTKLPHLVSLDVSDNKIVELESLHTRLGNVKILNLSKNGLSSLSGLSKLYSIVTLNVSFNNISELSDVEAICQLPCLEDLILTGNPVATVVDYRTRVLELFGKRACEICLDNERPTQKELDKVAVLQALRSAREGRLPSFSLSQAVPTASTCLQLERPDIGSVATE